MDLRKRVAAFCVFLIFLSGLASAQSQYAFRVSFKHKAETLSISNPEKFLSPRALARRAAQNVSVDERDIPVAAADLASVLSLTQGRLHSTSRWLNNCVVWLTDSSKILALYQHSNVESVQLVGYKPAQTSSNPRNPTPPSPVFKTSANPAYYGSAWPQTNFLNGGCLHDKGFRGKGKLIAILDDGFFYVNTAPGFDSVYSSGRIVDSVNFVQGGNDIYSSFLTHGSMVLSTMAATVPFTYVGAAPDAEYALYVTEAAGSETPIEMDNMVAAFERADSIGVDVISASIGYNTFDSPFPSLTPAQLDGKTTVAAIGANIAAQKGILVVITAGNEGSGGLLTPGDADSVLTVGNVDGNKVPASSSGYGPNFANHIKPEVVALGQPGAVLISGLSPTSSSGTSVSTPQIAGWAASLWQGSVGKTNVQIKQAIIKSGQLYPNPQMPQLGYGIPDFCKADVLLDIGDADDFFTSSTVFPNPFSNTISFNLQSKTSGKAQFSMTDLTGKLVFSTEVQLTASANRLSVTLPNSLASGMYLSKLEMDGRMKVFRLVKQ